MRRRLVASVFVILVLVPIACANPTPIARRTSPLHAPGIDVAKLYADNCAGCHGDRRQGVSGLGPSLDPADPAAHEDHHADAELRDIITNGRPGTAMPGFQGRLTPAEIDALIKFIRTTVQ